ncbi:tRNA(Ile)-lysidine synthase [Natronocella acetinitrilica]|uniref:tRNA(Ile)-lysidine synthase n=1 Tax=Natronocella acetinitrilica TaxID=414046 RepID=A0AAE3G7E0_9GAMM|nr:tRNA lysidine(34) synthetase TilS [Natronocella acetinitrilica]MCP1676166.1 tRNA(Ile)-lysidine synthase [Natronocella acetinitrilica]
MARRTLTPDGVLQALRELGADSVVHVGFSGGADSLALLHALSESRGAAPWELRAVHVNHHLQDAADAWEEHCQRVCDALDLPLTVLHVYPAGDANLEARARAARYQAWAELLKPGEALVTAHHQDDQAETLLLRALRGSGVDGLAAIPASRSLGAGRLLRPLLDVPRASLRHYVAEHGLHPVEDPSNACLARDRNFLRHEILPRLQQRWPDAVGVLARLADAAAESRRLGRDLAGVDGLPDGPVLDCTRLWALPGRRRRNLVRAWLQSLSLPPPGRQRLVQGLHDLLHAEPDRRPELRWPGGRIRRYRESLYADDGIDPPPFTAPRPWRGEERLLLPSGVLHTRCSSGAGLRAGVISSGVMVGGYRPGEYCQPVGRPHRPVKKLLQEAGIPPWSREQWPRLRLHGEIIAIPGVCICENHAADSGEPGLELRYEPRD